MRNYWEESWERKERRKMERQTMLVRLALVLVIIAIGIVTLIRLDTVLMQQTETLNQLMELRQEVEAVETEVVEEAEAVSLGEHRLSFYCSCPKCTGEWADGTTYTGTTATEGRTIAVDPSKIELGSKVYIDGLGEFIAEDIGGAIKENRIDIYLSSHSDCIRRGIEYREVWEVKDATL